MVALRESNQLEVLPAPRETLSQDGASTAEAAQVLRDSQIQWLHPRGHLNTFWRPSCFLPGIRGEWGRVMEREEVENPTFNLKLYLEISLIWGHPYHPHSLSCCFFCFFICKQTFIGKNNFDNKDEEGFKTTWWDTSFRFVLSLPVKQGHWTRSKWQTEMLPGWVKREAKCRVCAPSEEVSSLLALFSW